MKLFFKCFLLYFFSLVLLPCNEAEAGTCASGNVATIATQMKKTPHEHSDQCPPLCSCTCCNHCVIKALQALPVKSILYFLSAKYQYQTSLADMYYPIWQPPKLN